MKRKSVPVLSVLSILSICSAARAETQTWMANPADAFWNTISFDWNAGESWTNGNEAVFGDSSGKAIQLTEDITFASLNIQADGYGFSGPGRFVLPDAGVTSRVTVAENCVAAIDAPLTNPAASTPFVKQGPGTLTLAGTTTVARLHVAEGTLQIVSNAVRTTWIRVSNADTDADLLLDGATLTANCYSTVIGDVAPFRHAWLGAGVTTLDFFGNPVIAQPFETAPGLESDGGFVKTGDGTLIFSAKAVGSTFKGGVRVQTGQVRVAAAGTLGTGPVWITGESPLFASGDVVLSNKVIFTRAIDSAYVGSSDTVGANRLTLTSVGTAEGNTAHVIGFGRSNGNPSRAGLSLTQTNSEAVSQIKLRGALDFRIDGGVIKARSDAKSPFFDCSALTADAIAHVTENGFAFDAAAGANTSLGLTLQLAASYETTNYTRVAEAFANPGFETSTTGWTWGRVTNTAQESSLRYSNTAGFTPSDELKTTNGTCFAVLRRQNWMSSSFNVPSQGLWSVAFEMGCRGAFSNYASHLIVVTAEVDNVVYEIGPRSAQHPFRLFHLPPQVLSAGSHTLKLTTGSGTSNNDSLLFDDFHIAAVAEVHHAQPPVVKSGEGALTITNLVTDGRVTVSNGTLALMDYRLAGASLTVASNATLEVGTGILTNATVTVAKGGTLVFGRGPDLITNGDFEQESVDAGSLYSQTNALTGWTFELVNGQNQYSGAQRNVGTLSATKPWTTNGSQTAYVRSRTRMTTQVDVPEAGVYRLAFSYAARDYSDCYALPLYVEIDGVTNWTAEGQTEWYGYVSATVDVSLEAGTHALSFEVGGKKTYECLFLDAISLRRVDAGFLEMADSRLNLASGSTLDLENATPLTFPGGVYVDGEKFMGSQRKLERRGVSVTGTGKLQVGPPDGTLVIVR